MTLFSLFLTVIVLVLWIAGSVSGGIVLASIALVFLCIKIDYRRYDNDSRFEEFHHE